jgi:alpha-N-arabinofuranosidase
MTIAGRVGLALVSLFLAGAPAPAPAPLAVTVRVDASTVVNRIGPRLYGQFLEYMFQGIKGGLHAELLENRGFEEAADVTGLPRDWEREPNDRNDDRETTFAWDDDVALEPRATPWPADPSSHALRIRIHARYDGPRGVRQSRIPVRTGIAYRASFWLKTRDYDGGVRIALGQDREDGRVYASAVVPAVATDDTWRYHEVALTPSQADPLARLSIWFDGKGTLWLDQVSLMPGDAVDGVRADVFQRIAALKPAFLRWPGGNVAQDYHWQWGIGPRDRRPAWTNKAWWSEREPSDFGSDEFITLCRRLGAEPHVTVNVEGAGATPEEAAAWVEYMNGPPDSIYGAMRAADGHREPFGVKTWELGNEIWGDWVRGHSDAATYARNYRRYREAMLKVDPTLRLIAVGRDRTDWNDQVVAAVGREIDLLSLHHYEPPGDQADPRWLMARPLDFERYYRELGASLRARAGKPIPLIVNEWNTVLPLPRQHSMESALYAARLMNVFERTGDVVEMTAVSDLMNGWPGGIIQAGRHGVYVTPTYRVVELYNRFRGSERLAATVGSPTFDVAGGPTGVPIVDVVASRTADGRRYVLKLVNTDFDRAATVRVSIGGAAAPIKGRCYTLTAPRLTTANTFAAPDAVSVRTSAMSVAGRSVTVGVPGHAVTVVVLETR